jgi:hypothetical protein
MEKKWSGTSFSFKELCSFLALNIVQLESSFKILELVDNIKVQVDYIHLCNVNKLKSVFFNLTYSSEFKPFCIQFITQMY